MRCLLPVVCVFLMIGPIARASSKGQREKGATVFANTGCRQCHTIQNVGGKRGPDLSGVGRALKKEQIRDQILNGSKQMPPFKDVLQPSDVDDLVAYLRSCKQKVQN